MFKQAQKMRLWLSAVMAFMLVFTGIIPAGMGTAWAAGGISIDGFSVKDVGSTATNPYVQYESTINLSGSYILPVEGDNLRIKITGSSVDLSSTRPAVDKQNYTYTFNNVLLNPGINEITFYEDRGDLITNLRTIYVQYNNTPIFSDLKVNSIDMISDPTVVSVSSARNLEFSITGKAYNADKVTITNTTTGETFSDSVGQTGAFSVDVKHQIGLNELEIRAYNHNAEVGLDQRSVLATVNSSSSGQGSADQLYNMTVSGTSLIPNQTVTVSVANPETNTISFKGNLLLNYSGSRMPAQAGLQQKIVLRDITPNLSGQSDITTNTSDVKNKKDLGNGYYLYDIDSTTAKGLKNGHTYEVNFNYCYDEQTTSGGVTNTTSNKITTVQNYKYTFTVIDSETPVLKGVTYKDTNGNVQNIILGTTVNTLRSSPVTLTVNTSNITSTSNFKIYKNDKQLTKDTDYKLTSDSDGKFILTFVNQPASNTKITVEYNDTQKIPLTGKTSLSFYIKVAISPYVSLTTTDKPAVIIQDRYEVSSEKLPALDGQVSNYSLSLNSTSDIGIKLNDKPIDFKIADTKSFKITGGVSLNPGNNKLEVTLLRSPTVKYTYTIFYNNGTAPKIKDFRIKVVQNNKEIELTKPSTQSAYTTSSFFLSNFTFSVDNASMVTVYKDGKPLATYEKSGSSWNFNGTSNDYQNLKKDASNNGKNNLDNQFDKYNFKDQSGDSFEAEMTSKQYGDDLIETLGKENLEKDEYERRLALFPLNLNKNATTTYEIEVRDSNTTGATVARQKIIINQQLNAWQLISPIKKDNEKYITVNTNSVHLKLFAEKATKVLFGKTEAVASNTTKPDFQYDETVGKALPKTYYVFEADVPLKSGLNTVKFTVEVGSQKYSDQVQIYNANSSVTGAESRDVLGKKLSFSVFDKGFELKFPSGTVLLSPSNDKEGQETNVPSQHIFTNVPIYFGIADRTTGQVTISDNGLEDDMADVLRLDTKFNYASPLYYVDAGNAARDADDEDIAPVGRDPYFDDKVTVGTKQVDMKPFIKRYKDNLVPSKVGTISIKYDPSIVNAANNTLAVFYNNGREWRNIGGVTDTGKKVVTVPFKGFGYYMIMKTRESFSDVVHHEFARDALETLYAKGIMNRAENVSGGFGTELKITRGEFATMVVKALDLPINAGPYQDNNEKVPSEPTFRDVRPSNDGWAYQYKYIETAARAGIIRGKDAGAFFPDDPLTREEAAVIIARALNLKTNQTPDAAKLTLGKLFTDAQLVGYYAGPAVVVVTKAKIMNGEPNDPTVKKPTYKFKPSAFLTRAEMAVITVRIMQKLKKLK